MYRKFAFEGDVHETLALIPLAVRRKLDLSGRKISRVGWEALPFAERAVLCHLPVEREDEVSVFRGALVHFAERAGVRLEGIDERESDRARWAAQPGAPAAVSERLARVGMPMPGAWETLDDEARYCLVKYADPKKREESFAALVRELALEQR
jgi:hypothetical protein